MKDHFKFTIHLKRNLGLTSFQHQLVSITTQAPYLYMTYALDDRLDDEAQLRLVKAELKLAMIDALMNGEWKLE
jgi:hypothetical protein